MSTKYKPMSSTEITHTRFCWRKIQSQVDRRAIVRQVQHVGSRRLVLLSSVVRMSSAAIENAIENFNQSQTLLT